MKKEVIQVKINKQLKLCLVVTIIVYFVLTLIPGRSNFSYAGRVAAGTLTSDIDGIDEGLYPGYKNLIYNLRNIKPNYNFQLYYTGLDWNEVLVGEYQSHGSSPLNLFTAKTNYTGMWYCPICGTRKYDNGTLCCASREAIAYMMDPRNSINESDIFQFKALEGSDVSVEDITRVVSGKGAFLNNPEAIQAIYDASVMYNINGYFLVAKIINEHGNNGTVLTSGNGYNGNYVGCYNYFNVGSYGNGSAAIINNGLEYAQKNGWTSIRASILGGAQIVKNNYIDTRKQNTLYFQKFNVVYSSALFSYQYQTNIMAAQSQGSSLKSYYGSSTTASSYTFIIPVYENMPTSACARPDVNVTNTINYEDGVVTNVSSSLKVRASGRLSGMAIGKLNNGESIKILQRATTQVDGYYWDLIVSNVDGTYGYAARNVGGDICISSKGSSGSSSGAAGSGGDNTSSNTNPNDMKTVISGSFLKVLPGATYEIIKQQYPDAIATAVGGGQITSGILGTGTIVTISGNNYTIVKKGDVNGDGYADITDAVMMLNCLKGINPFIDIQLEAGKVKNEAEFSITDIVFLLNYMKGIANIEI